MLVLAPCSLFYQTGGNARDQMEKYKNLSLLTSSLLVEKEREVSN